MAGLSLNRVLRYGAALLGAAGTDGPTPEDAIVGERPAPEEPARGGTAGAGAPWLVLAGGLVLLLGVSSIVYAPFLPVPGDLATSVQLPLLGSSPAAVLAFGCLAIAAAVGVFLRAGWGRGLALLVVGLRLAYSAWLTVDRIGPGAGPGTLGGAIVAGMWIDLVLAAVVLYVLARRWPARASARPSPEAPSPPR